MLTFSSNIYLVPKQIFQSVIDAQGMHAPDDYAKENFDPGGRPVRIQPKGYTQNAWGCNILGLLNTPQVSDASGSLYHLLPRNTRPELLNSLKTMLQQDTFDLNPRAQKHAVHGLITGGNIHVANSRDLYESLRAVFSRFNLLAPFSQIWGRTSGVPHPGKAPPQTSLLYHAPTDSWCLQSDKADNAHPESYPNDILTRRELEDAYEVVEIAPGDRLITPENSEYQLGVDRLLNT